MDPFQKKDEYLDPLSLVKYGIYETGTVVLQVKILTDSHP